MISVIIPTHNRRELLLRAVGSVLSQTYRELECIVVDDASTDGTQMAVLELRDDRVRYVRMERNMGACAARNCGIDMARGEYIAFQDSDDVWYPDKLEKQLALLTLSEADVVSCAMSRVYPSGDTEVFPRQIVNVPLERNCLLLENLTSTQCILGKAEVFRSVRFDEQLPRLQDWDLMLRISREYRITLGCEPLVDVYVQQDSISQQPRKLLDALRRLYEKFHEDIVRPDAVIVDGQRVDEQWIYMMERAAADCGEELWTADLLAKAPDWVYRQGEAAGYKRSLILLPGCRLRQNYLPDTTVLYTDLRSCTPGPGMRYLPKVLLKDALLSGGERISFVPGEGQTDDRPLGTALRELAARYGRRYAWELLSEVSGRVHVAAELAVSQLMDMSGWAHALQDGQLPVKGGAVKRVAVYYHSMRNGGVQQAAAALARIWAQMGMQVTVITAEEPTPEDYALPEGCVRRVIPRFDHTDAQARYTHVLDLARIAKGSDVLVYHAWADPLVLFDLLAVRSAGTRCIIHTHSVFTMPLLEKTMLDRFMALPEVYALADGVVTLSDVDRSYWGLSNARVYTTVHPLTFDLKEVTPNCLGGHTILWAGRLSEEKRPMEALAVMREVVREVPDARMILLGGGNAELEGQMQRYIAANGLERHVELAGFRRDVRPCYARADVLLCTSAYEGFGLTMAEAATFGIPCVSYDMPYLTVQQGGGFLTVAQQDIIGAAGAIVRLLRDGEMRRRLGREARENAETRLSIDQKALWQRIFDDQQRVLPPMALTNAQAMMLRTLREHVALSRTHTAAVQAPAAYQTTFVPLPEKGPARTLRKKAATFLQVLLIDGPKGVRRVLKEKKEDKR